MNWMVAVFVGRRYLGNRRQSQLVSFISGLSILGLVLSVAVLVLVLSVMNGFDQELRNRILALVPQVSVYHREGIEHWEDVAKDLEQHRDVQAAAPFVQVQALLAHKNKAEPVVVYGIDPKYEVKVSVIESYLALDDLTKLQGKEHHAIMGAGLAKKLSLEVGERARVLIPNISAGRAPRIESITLIGLLNTKTELDNSLLLLPIKVAASMTPHPDKVSGIRLKVLDLLRASSLAYELVRPMEYGYYTSNWTRTHGNLYHAVQMSKSLVGVLLFLIIAIAAFNLVSSLMMVVVDKEGDIAIFRTLGMKGKEIMAVFIIQGSLIGAVGAGLGALLGILLASTVQPLIAWFESSMNIQFLKSDVYPISYVPSDIRLSDIATVVLISLLLSFLATLYPAWRASRVEPAEALRFE